MFPCQVVFQTSEAKETCLIVTNLSGIQASEEYEKPPINFLGRWAIQGLNLARTSMMQQMMQVYRNTCDRSVNKKNKKSPKGTTRPPKMNKNTLHAFRHTPWWIFNL